MTAINWEEVLGQLDDKFIEEAIGSYEQCSVVPFPDEKENPMTRKTKKLTRHTLAIAAVLALVAALSITAFAVFPSLIFRLGDGYYANADDQRNARYQQMGELSDKTPVSVELTAGGTLTKVESYYDGEDMALAYSLSGCEATVEFGFGPEDENFEHLFTPNENNQTSISQIWFSHGLPASEFVKAQAELLTTGKVGFVVRYMDIGDHAKLDDGTELGPLTGAYLDGNVVLECQNGLPEEAKYRDELTVQLGVKEYVAYYYVEGDTVSWYCPVVEPEWVSFTLTNLNAD